MPKKYPLEFKKQAIRRYKKGESIPALCQELHISQSTFYHWRSRGIEMHSSANGASCYTIHKENIIIWRYLEMRR